MATRRCFARKSQKEAQKSLFCGDGAAGRVALPREVVRTLDPRVGRGWELANLHLGNLATLVVAAQDGDPVRVAHFERDEQRDRLDRVVAAVDVVTHEQVVRVGRLATDLEELEQVVELAVDVTADGHRGAHLLHVRLVDEDFFRLDTCAEKTESVRHP